jgi:hypothetical protein
MADGASQTTTDLMLEVSEATGEGLEVTMVRSETSVIGREKGRCLLSLLAQLLFERVDARGVRRVFARTPHLGAKGGLKMDLDLHAASSPNAHPLSGSLPHLSSIASGARE